MVPWSCSFGWCLAEGLEIVAASWAKWLSKDFTTITVKIFIYHMVGNSKQTLSETKRRQQYERASVRSCQQ